MTEAPVEVAEASSPRRRRRRVLLIIAAVLVVLAAWAAWIGIRASLARDELTSAQSQIEAVRADVERGDLTALRGVAGAVRQHADRAAGLTSDPIWRATEWVPIAGPNLIAFRETAGVIDDVAGKALPPLVTIAGRVDVSQLAPTGGRIDPAPLADNATGLRSADTALQAASARAQTIPTDGTIDQLHQAVLKLRDLLGTASGALHGARVAADVLPGMLGTTGGPRHYLLLFQNNAELRASGGIPGVVVMLTADDGRLSLGDPVAGASFGQTVRPILPLTAAEQAIFGDQLGEIMQDVTATPDFSRTGQLAAAMWQNRFGGTIDGVISADPVALSYILDSTGPVALADGSQLDSGNAVDLLLSQAYARFNDPNAQDAFFASAASSVFSKLTDGAAQPTRLIQALARAVGERRLLVWSARGAEQREIAQTSVAGGLPTSTAASPTVGVFLNDGTLAKMDYYLRADATLAHGVCRADGRVNYRLTLTLASTAPADAASVLPDYVLGAFAGQVPRGVTRTTALIYLPSDLTPLKVTRDGAAAQVGGAVQDGRRVVSLRVDLDPSTSTTLVFDLLGTATKPAQPQLEVTPMSTPMRTTADATLDCKGL